MKKIKKYVSLLLCTTLLINSLVALCPAKAYAEQICELVKINVDGNETDARALCFDYDNNMYISLLDLAEAMKNTDKAFHIEWSTMDDDKYIILAPGAPEADEDSDRKADGEEGEGPFEGFTEGEKVNLTRKRLPVRIGDNDYKFYIILSASKENPNGYINCGELAMAMNIDMTVQDNRVTINSKGEFDFNKYNLDDMGVACMADSCLVGDITTGNIYYESNADEAVAIASTTKLMTYLIIKEAMEKGEISENDTVTFSKKVSDLSATSSGVVSLTAGNSANIKDVMAAMLICSSNECALALAEHLCGDEETFVERMNQKAIALGLSENAVFRNPHGLPTYREQVLTAKLQNIMTANDMFLLTTHILNTYPEITEITSVKKTKLESLGNFEARNTNVLLYNVPGCVGLKTGTTDKAQSCLVSAYQAEDIKGETHYIVTIVYGCESSLTQSYLSMLLMRYGIQKFNASELGITPERGDNAEIPGDLESMIGAVINTARRNSK